MSISAPFIRHPVGTTLLTVGLVLSGVLAYRELPVSTLPQVEYPTIQITTLLPGASAETMASAVTTPLERQLGQMPSLSQMSSTSSFGTSLITLQFELDRDIDAAEQDVQAAINAAANLLPPTLPLPPVYAKSNPADAPILTLAATSPTLPLDRISDFADSILAQKVAQVSGVGLVTISGLQKPAVRVQVDPLAMAGVALSLEDIRTVLTQSNVNQPKGNIDGPRLDYTLASNDQLTGAAQFPPLVVAYRNGSPVRLADVGTAVDGVENAQLAGWANGQRAIIINVQRQPGANVIDTADRVKALLPRLRAALPGSLSVSMLNDRTETVRASIAEVQVTLLLTIVLVVAVNFLFLRRLRATLIPGLAVPVSLVGSFGIMYLAGFSLDNLSLMALTIATGFVVDDAIVMQENITRYLEQGEPPLQAALKGSRQIGFTIVSLTVSLVAVLIPLLFMGGVIGRLFREFAVTLAIAIGMSAVLSLTLTATMCAHLLHPATASHEEESRFSRWAEQGFERLRRFYDRGLGWVLDHQSLMLLVTLGTLALTMLLVFIIPKGFFPLQDTGLIQGVSQAPPGTSFEEMGRRQQALAEIVQADPAVNDVASFIGADGTNPTPNTGRLLISLKPRDRRKASVSDVMARLDLRLASVPGISLHMQPAQDLQIETAVGRARYQYSLSHTDAAELHEFAARALERLRQRPELAGVTSDEQQGGRQTSLVIDRTTASRLGVPVQAIADTLYDAFGQRIVSTIFTQLNQYRVILEVTPEARRDPQSLDRLFVRSTAGAAVPLRAVTEQKTGSAALAVNHRDQFPSVTISFDTARGVSLGAAVRAIERTVQELGPPAGIRYGFIGTAEAFRDSLASEPFLIVAALLTVYIVLGVLYESYVHPVTILSTLPSAGVGALLALLLLRLDFTIIALIGVVLLIGIVKKNAIMMIDFALDAQRGEGMAPRDAIHQACLLRFRPIMMTTMAALLGAVPLAVSTGTGSELRRPLGITIIGGLLLSQLLTLYTTPVIYLALERVRGWAGRRRRRTQQPAGAGQPA